MNQIAQSITPLSRLTILHRKKRVYGEAAYRVKGNELSSHAFA